MLTSTCQDRTLYCDGLYYFEPSVSNENINHKRTEGLKGFHENSKEGMVRLHKKPDFI